MLTFNAERHEYTWNGAIVPSVTQVLAQFYNWERIDPEVLERKRQIGVAAHAAIALDVAGDLDESSVDPVVAPYLKAWRRFLREMDIKDADIGPCERPLYHPGGFAGTPDITVFTDRWSVIDVKTALALSPVWGLQTAAYRALLNANASATEHLVERRFSLRLDDDGTYKLHEHKNPSDLAVFTSALTTFNWSRANLGSNHG